MSLRIEYDERRSARRPRSSATRRAFARSWTRSTGWPTIPIRPVVIGGGGDFVSFADEYHLARRPASSRSRALILPGRAISGVRRESLSATLSPVVHSIPEDDWVSAEAEALLDATPGLREDLRAAMDELHAGTLQTVDAATARARIEARIKSRSSS